jgi:purine-nucleoside phosphorylase
MVLGSGFRDVVKEWSTRIEIPMSDVPSYPCPQVEGHGTKLIGARITVGTKKVDALIATGRIHLYEGYSAHSTCLPIFMAHEMGIKSIILTNAAGGISAKAKQGSIIALSDHLNLMGQNVAGAATTDLRHQFVEMVDAYNSAWREHVCRSVGIESGVYAGMAGPTFETPAEAKMLRIMGADLAGMSTVQETIAARMCGQKVFACSFVTNESGGSGVEHTDVLKSVAKSYDTIKQTLETAATYLEP